MEDTTAQYDGAAISPVATSLDESNQAGADASRIVNTAVATAVFNLFDLPAEIVIRVFESLMPDPLPIGTGLPLPTDTLASRKALVNLCLTSKECNEIALPLIYKNVVITTHVQTATLLVNLMTYNNRRGWIRSLAVVAGLEYDEHSRQKDRAILTRAMAWLDKHETRDQESMMLGLFHDVRTLLPELSDHIQAIPVPDEVYALPRVLYHFGRGDSYWDDYERGLHQLYQQLLQFVIRLQTKVQDILVTVPEPSFDHHISPAAFEDWTFGQTHIPSSVQARADRENPFKTLRSIRKQADPSKDVNFKPHVQLEHLKCQQWELFRDDGNWFFLCSTDHGGWPLSTEHPRHLLAFLHITELKLHETKTHPALLRLMLSYSKNLKSLCYTTNATEWNVNFSTPALPADEALAITLQQALDEVSGALSELRLGWVPWGADLTEEEEAAVAPHRVDVGSFSQIKSVDIDLPFARKDDDECENIERDTE
ncbi:hypothetical protein INS49_005331 [Diaporthe citri]|uniref:uncharacterized protein n=1 Tax=Diaporthe citri TaxID=83186 RepID=UPI001C8149BF|nr:uncharacterized protein INS49_005331 [Diaporthe citri]KAG6353623.1 hypothetical protein INS49_005331 [Diaporthe citri]